MVVVTGYHPGPWEGLLYAFGSPAIALAFVAALAFPLMRRIFERTPFASFALFAAAVICVAQYWLTALTEIAYEAPAGDWIKGIDWETLYAKFGRGYFCIVLLETALALFLLAQVRRLITGALPQIRPIEISALDHAEVRQRRSTTWSQRIWSFFRQPFVRARIVRDFNSAPLLLSNQDFSPLGFAVQLAIIAGLPASMLGVMQSGAGTAAALPSDNMGAGVLALFYDGVRPFQVPAVLVFLSWLGSWSLVGGWKLRPVRGLYQMIDGAISFWPLMAFAFAAALGFPSPDMRNEYANTLSDIASDILRHTKDWFGDDGFDWYEWLRDFVSYDIVGKGTEVSIFAATWIAPLWLVAIRLLRTPRIVGAFIGSGPVFLVRHGLVFLILAGAIAAVAWTFVASLSP